MPEFRVSSADPTRSKRIKFVMHDGHLEVANALRRVILAEIPTIAPKYDQYHSEDHAVNDIFITTNTTVLHDQIMGHRISMLPIHMGFSAISKHERGDLRFEIDAVNNSNEPLDITTQDVIVYDSTGSPLNASQRDILLPPDAVTGDYPIITRLKPNKSDAFKCTFYARRGVARENARWCAASTCSMMNVVDEEAAMLAMNKKLEVLGSDEKEIREQHETIEKYRSFKKDALGDPSEIEFDVESECGLTGADIVVNAMDVILDKFSAFRGKLTVVGAHPEDAALFVLSLVDEDHTFGNLYQALCFRMYPDRIPYVGYYMPHPLERKITIKLKLASGKDDLEKFLSESVEGMSAHIQGLRDSFTQEVGLV